MSVFVDRKYLLLICSRLERFSEKKEDLFNFRCPYCGDSKKNKIKARGYVFRKNNDYFYQCHNCGTSTTFSKFLEHVDSHTHREYVLERYSLGGSKYENYKKPDREFFDLKGPNPLERFSENIKNIFSIKANNIFSLENGHCAKEYIRNRRIPQKYWKEIFFAEDFKLFMDENFPNHGKELIEDDPRVILLYTNKRGDITNVAGRSLSNSKQRYITVKISEEKKIFGTHRMDISDRVYIVEGQFDSLFLYNSVASGDSNLCSLADYIHKNMQVDETVLIYDNQPRNKEIVKQMNKAISGGHNVCLFPKEMDKDINEMILQGYSSEELMQIIDTNTYCGLEAELQFSGWRMI